MSCLWAGRASRPCDQLGQGQFSTALPFSQPNRRGFPFTVDGRYMTGNLTPGTISYRPWNWLVATWMWSLAEAGFGTPVASSPVAWRGRRWHVMQMKPRGLTQREDVMLRLNDCSHPLFTLTLWFCLQWIVMCCLVFTVCCAIMKCSRSATCIYCIVSVCNKHFFFSNLLPWTLCYPFFAVVSNECSVVFSFCLFNLLRSETLFWFWFWEQIKLCWGGYLVFARRTRGFLNVVWKVGFELRFLRKGL